MLLGCSGGPSVGPPGKKDGLKVCWWSSGWTTWQRSLLPSGPSLSPFRQGGAAQDARVRLMEDFSFHQAQKTAKTLPMEPNSFHQAHLPLFLPPGAFAPFLQLKAPTPVFSSERSESRNLLVTTFPKYFLSLLSSTKSRLWNESSIFTRSATSSRTWLYWNWSVKVRLTVAWRAQRMKTG